MTAQSYLFVPGDSERKITKALRSTADALIFDLEDSVLPERTAYARGLVQSVLKDDSSRPAPELWVRVNALSTSKTMADIEAILCVGLHGIVVPKVESAEDLTAIHKMLTASESAMGLTRGGARVFAMVLETPRALLSLDGYAGAHARLTAMTWGAEDLSVALGAVTNRDKSGGLLFTYRMARSLCLVAAKAAGAAAIETLWPDFRDLDGLKQCAAAARQEGFAGMIAIHPDQVPVINAAFAPTDEEIAYARRVVDAFAAIPGTGAVALDGRMLDIPHLKRAQALLSAALAHSNRRDG